MSLDPALRSRIETLLQSNRVVLFMKGAPDAPQCGFSAKAVGVLNALRPSSYAHVDVLADAEIREGIKQYGNWPTIPQLYIDGELVGGSDIVEQMASCGELHGVLGLAAAGPHARRRSRITPAAVEMLRGAIDNAGGGYAVQLDIDARHNAKLQLAPVDANAIAVEVDGVRVQTDLAAARVAPTASASTGSTTNAAAAWSCDNPHAPPPVQPLSPPKSMRACAPATLRLVDVRPAEERALAAVAGAVRHVRRRPATRSRRCRRTRALAFLCHHGGRSQQAAEHFRGLGFREVYNVVGGIDAWADLDAAHRKY